MYHEITARRRPAQPRRPAFIPRTVEQMASYEALVRQLFNVSRFAGMKLGLSNMERLSELLGLPHTKFRSVHVTGTNGWYRNWTLHCLWLHFVVLNLPSCFIVLLLLQSPTENQNYPGKGSVSTKIAVGLQHSGLNVGLFTSPHISTFRERVSSCVSLRTVPYWPHFVALPSQNFASMYHFHFVESLLSQRSAHLGG